MLRIQLPATKMNTEKTTFLERLNPRTLFLIDGLGALLTAIMLGLIMPQWVSVFGIPKKTLYILAALPCIYVLYDLFCYFYTYQSPIFLRIIAGLNLLYCAISITFAIYNKDVLTALGWTYITIEIAIIIFISAIELKVASLMSKL